jgi:5-methylcytosine-specific restriction endonuclease McrA
MSSARPPVGMRPWKGRYSQQWAAATLAAYGTTCHLCRRPGADTADHLTPRARGGLDTLANLRPAHHGCNSKRGVMSLAEWFARHPVPRRDPLAPSRQW